MNLVNYGVIGVGFGKNYIKTIQNDLSDLAQVNYICSKTIQDHANYSKALVRDYKILCQSDLIECVVVASPANLHFEMAKCALENSKHTILEKPMTLKYDQALELNELAKAKKLNLAVNHSDLYNGGYLEIKSQLPPEDITFIEYNIGHWSEPRLDCSTLFDYHSHSIAVCLDLLQKMPISLEVDGNSTTVVLKLDFGNKVFARLVGNRLTKNKQRNYDAWTINDHWLYDDVRKMLWQNKSEDYIERQFDKTPPLTNLLKQFSQAVQSNQTVFNADLACNVIKLLEEAEKSIK